MKFILSLVLTVGLALESFGTGAFPNNLTQTGTTTYSVSTGLILTNTFAETFTVIPLVQVFPTSTNGAPFVVSAVTVSNFILTATANTPTNCSAFWQASLGYPRIQSGTNVLTGATPLLITFPTPYAAGYAPTVTVSGSTTNLNSIIGVNPVNVTYTNFTVLGNNTGVVTWQSFGICPTPGATTVTY